MVIMCERYGKTIFLHVLLYSNCIIYVNVYRYYAYDANKINK